MQVSVENTSELGRRIRVTVPAERVEQEFTSRLKRLSGKAKLPGFRPGKIPVKVLEAKFGRQVLNEIGSELIQSTFQEALGMEGLRPAGGPRIDPGAPQRGKEYAYTAEFEIYPEIPKPDLVNIKIKRPVSEIQNKDIDRMIETLRKQRRKWEDVEREAVNGDQLVIDFTGTMDGETFAGGEAQDFVLELGSATLIDGFEEGLAGAKAGEQRELDLSFPDNYSAAHLKGKPVKFAVKVKAVRESSLPEMDAEFIKQFGIENGQTKDFRAEIQKNLQREKHKQLRALLSQRVIDALIERNPIEIPAALVEEDIHRQQQSTGAKTDVLPAEASEDERERARRRVATGLILAEVVRREGLKSDTKKVQARVDEMADEYDNPKEFRQWLSSDPSRLREIENMILEEEIIELLLTKANVAEDVISFKELADGKIK